MVIIRSFGIAETTSFFRIAVPSFSVCPGSPLLTQMCIRDRLINEVKAYQLESPATVKLPKLSPTEMELVREEMS